ncbi:MAG: curli production assembly protein CsgG [Kordiimonas sp.]|nr:curli production assembly protein CsgG [Kordiimonas sp.]
MLLRSKHSRILCTAAVLLSSAAITTPTLALDTTAALAQASSAQAQKKLKLKLALGRFTNETVYGKSLLRDQDLDPLGKQAADILSTYLIQSGKFMVFERPDLVKIQREQNVSGQAADSNLIGADTLILGSVVEFGRTTDGKRGLFNKKKIQRAHAKVAIRLVDVKTGHVFHSATGQGEANTETSTVLGMGSSSKYNATLSDKVLSLAIEDVIEELINTLSGRTWKTDILKVSDKTVFISGGKTQGLQVGDKLTVMKAGETIQSGQTGFNIALPPEKVGELEVVSLFGDSELNEGAVTRLTTGTLENGRPEGLFVTTPQ